MFCHTLECSIMAADLMDDESPAVWRNCHLVTTECWYAIQIPHDIGDIDVTVCSHGIHALYQGGGIG
jgi:hypothetical protein